MARTSFTAVAVVVAVGMVAGAPDNAFAQAADPGGPKPSVTSTPGAHDLPRIRKGLERPASVIDWTLPTGTPMFRVNVEEKFPDVTAWLGDPRDLKSGPIAYPAYHDEFLRMVTPREVGAAYTNGELAQVLATGLAFGFALQQATKAVRSIVTSVTSARSQRACEEVAATLADLNQERAKAGLPPVPVPGC